jgi:hypothetical protein
MRIASLVAPGWKDNYVTEPAIASDKRGNGSRLKQDGSGSYSRQQQESPASRQTAVARQYMRMSEAHDRIRMNILGGRLFRVR